MHHIRLICNVIALVHCIAHILAFTQGCLLLISPLHVLEGIYLVDSVTFFILEGKIIRKTSLTSHMGRVNCECSVWNKVLLLHDHLCSSSLLRSIYCLNSGCLLSGWLWLWDTRWDVLGCLLTAQIQWISKSEIGKKSVGENRNERILCFPRWKHLVCHN